LITNPIKTSMQASSCRINDIIPTSSGEVSVSSQSLKTNYIWTIRLGSQRWATLDLECWVSEGGDKFKIKMSLSFSRTRVKASILGDNWLNVDKPSIWTSLIALFFDMIQDIVIIIWISMIDNCKLVGVCEGVFGDFPLVIRWSHLKDSLNLITIRTITLHSNIPTILTPQVANWIQLDVKVEIWKGMKVLKNAYSGREFFRPSRTTIVAASSRIATLANWARTSVWAAWSTFMRAKLTIERG